MTKTKTTSAKKNTRTGRLRIGDQWNAINIIARSQTHPLKAVCELTENAIDARSTQIQIVRRRSKGELYLEVNDNGEGVPTNDAGEPDFTRIATHVCDSMKRYLDAQQRAGVHGEFGIGLLSFWSLGEQLRMASVASNGRVFEMLLTRGQRNYLVRPLRGNLALPGTRVVVGPLLESTKKVVTGEKLARYLATELRDRLRSSGVQVVVLDRVSRKEVVVRPREFEGDRIELPSGLRTAFGTVSVELYFAEGGSRRPDGGVAICKDGTRVLKDITELVQLQHPPWTESRVEGVIDFPALQLAPGTRGGIVPDEHLTAFVQALQSLELALTKELEERDQAESDKVSRDILKQVHRAFRNALRDLPSNEYLFFDVPEPKTRLSSGSQPDNGHGPREAGVPLSTSADPCSDHSDPGEAPAMLPLEPGPLDSVRIAPRHARRAPGEVCVLTATAYDEHGIPIPEGIEYTWCILEGDAVVTAEGGNSQLRSDETGQVVVQVGAIQGNNLASDQVTVKFLEQARRDDDESSKGLPSYRLEAEHGKPWRSRYDDTSNEIVINSAHRDFSSSRTTAAKHRRYIGKLYAKEVVLINFPHESPAEILERLIQLTLRTEDVL